MLVWHCRIVKQENGRWAYSAVVEDVKHTIRFTKGDVVEEITAPKRSVAAGVWTPPPHGKRNLTDYATQRGARQSIERYAKRFHVSEVNVENMLFDAEAGRREAT